MNIAEMLGTACVAVGLGCVGILAVAGIVLVTWIQSQE